MMDSTPVSAFTNLNTDRYERAFDLKDSPVRSVFEPSEKSLRGFCRCESLATALYVRECEIDPNTEWLIDEPGPLHYPYEGRLQKCFPDLKKRYRSGQQKIVEIKSARHRGDLELRARYRAIAEVCRQQEFEFQLIFSDRLYREPKRTNVALIHYYRRSDVTEHELNVLRDYLNKQEQATLQAAITACPDLNLPKICSLVAKGYVWVNLFKLITMRSTIRLPRSLASSPAFGSR